MFKFPERFKSTAKFFVDNTMSTGMFNTVENNFARSSLLACASWFPYS